MLNDIKVYKYDTAICDNPKGILEGACPQCWNKHNPDKKVSYTNTCKKCVEENIYHGIDSINFVSDPALDEVNYTVPPLLTKDNHRFIFINPEKE